MYFDRVDTIGNIKCYIKSKDGRLTQIVFFKNGCYSALSNAKCVIFPKGKTTWEGFQRPFKDGDIVTWEDRGSLVACIYKERKNTTTFNHHIALYKGGLGIVVNGEIALTDDELCFATSEEKQKLFQAIKDNGYKWNPETKTLEKLPKFKVGDRITDKNKFIYRITEITDKGYKLHDLKTTFITFEEADWYFVKVVDIFDIDTLIPFESRVLVRSSYGDIWRPAIYGFFDSKKHYHYVVGGSYWTQCIPYEVNKELLGTTNNPKGYESE